MGNSSQHVDHWVLGDMASLLRRASELLFVASPSRKLAVVFLRVRRGLLLTWSESFQAEVGTLTLRLGGAELNRQVRHVFVLSTLAAT